MNFNALQSVHRRFELDRNERPGFIEKPGLFFAIVNGPSRRQVCRRLRPADGNLYAASVEFLQHAKEGHEILLLLCIQLQLQDKIEELHGVIQC